jgi:acyl-CoA thioester hydrolase
MYNLKEGYLAATSEQIGVHVDMQTRKSSPLPEEVQISLANLMEEHSLLAKPEQLGHQIGIKRK